MLSRGVASSSAFVIVAIATLISLVVGIRSVGEYSVSSWTAWNSATLPYSVRFASSVTASRFILVGGGFEDRLGLPNSMGSTSLSFVDPATGASDLPLSIETVYEHHTVTHEKLVGNKTVNVTETVITNHTRIAIARLLLPVAGPNTMTSCGGDVYVLGMCSIVPQGFTVDTRNGTELPEYFRTVQRLRPVRPPENLTSFITTHNLTAPNGDQLPLFDYNYDVPLLNISMKVISSQDTPGRFNASCVCEGGYIYVVGGVLLSTMAVTSQVARYDPATNRLLLILDWGEKVVNPALAVDDQALYIIGGDTLEGETQTTFSYYFVTNAEFSPKVGGYPMVLGSHLVQLAVINGSALVLGGDYTTLITHSLWLQNADWGIQRLGRIGVRHSSITIVPNGQNVSMYLFGGYDDDANAVQSAIYESRVFLPYAIPEFIGTAARSSDDSNTTEWTPDSFGNFTRLRGYDVLWFNVSTSMLLLTPAAVAATMGPLGVLNVCGLQSTCTLRLSSTPQCVDSIADGGDVVIINGTTAFAGEMRVKRHRRDETFSLVNATRVDSFVMTSYGGDTTMNPVSYHVDEGGDPVDIGGGSSSSFAVQRLPLVYVCVSTGNVPMTGCSPDPCEASYFTPLNALSPLMWTQRIVVPPPPPPTPTPSADTAAPSAGPPDPPAPRTTSAPSYVKFILIGAGVAILLTIATAMLLRARWRSNAAALDEESSLLRNEGGGNYHGRGGGIDPSQTKDGMLDGRYRIMQRLGKGAFSVVYLVERPSDGRKFALKYVQCHDDFDRQEAMKECEVIRKLQGHPNVINLVDMFLSYKFDTNLSASPTNTGVYNEHFYEPEDEGAARGERYLSLVMEYHELGDLGRYVRRQKHAGAAIPEATIVSIAYQLFSVLNFMHSRKPPLAHRDLKPENILLSSARFENVALTFLPIVVTDFGLSRAMDKTFCESAVGSLPYVAPEVFARRYTVTGDCWSSGCILYAVATRRVEPEAVRVMFADATRPDFRDGIVNDIVQRGYSEQLGRFIAFLLDPNPDTRPSAADALRKIRKRFGDDLQKASASPQLPNVAAESQCEFFLASDEFGGGNPLLSERELGTVMRLSASPSALDGVA